MSSSLRARWLSSLALVGTLTAAPPCPAQTPQEMATRRLLLDHAEAARAAGRHAEALDLYGRAGQIQMTPSVRALIADAQGHVGLVVEALGSADMCLRDLGTVAVLNQREAIESHCRALRDELRRRVGELVVMPPEPAPAGLRVTVGGVDLAASLLGAPTAVAPGDVVVVATVGGVERWRETVRVTAREATTARVVLSPEIVLPPPSPPPPPVLATLTTPRARRPRVTAPAHDQTPPPVPRGRVLGWAAVGGATAGALAGAVALIIQRGRASEFNAAEFPVDACDATCVELRSSAEAASTATWVGYGIGAAFGVAAVVLFATSPSPRRATAGLRCGPGPGTMGAACALAF